MTDANFRRVDEVAVERILKAVGEKFVPANIDRATLQQDLERRGYLYGLTVEINNLTLARRREKQLTRMRNACNRLLKMDDDVWDLITGTRAAFRGPHNEDPRHAIQCLVVDIDRTFRPPFGPEHWVAGDESLGLSDEGSPFERLVGKDLPIVFAKHFPGKRAGYTVSDVLVDGPYIRFAERVLVALNITNRGIPYARHSIADAVTKYRKAGNFRGKIFAGKKRAT
jgi:hypothetical protein